MLVATEVGILHQLRALNAGTNFIPMNDRAACRSMKMIAPAKLLHTLRTGDGVVEVAPATGARARKAVEAMISIGEPAEAGSSPLTPRSRFGRVPRDPGRKGSRAPLPGGSP